MFGHVVQVLGPVWSARLISLTTIFIETFADMFAFGRKLGHGTVHWLGGSSSIWVFMRENVGPLPSSAVENYRTNPNVSWHFDLSDTTLSYTDPAHEYPDGENVIVEPNRLPWLSAKVVFSGGNEYDLDEFGSDFHFIAPRGVKPTPKLILNCWSIWSKVWLLPGQDARFVIINEDGEEETFFIHSRPSTEVDRWSDIFEIDSEEEEEEAENDDSESESGSEGATEGGEEDEAATEAVSQGGEDADDEGTDSEMLDGLNISENSGNSGDSAAASDESHTPPEVVEEPKVDE